VCHTFVAVQKWMVERQREAKGSGLGTDRVMQVGATEVSRGCARADSRTASWRMP
jgi:hypothetical protein